MVRACREAAAERITCVIPCFPYWTDKEKDIVENGNVIEKGNDNVIGKGNGNGDDIEKGKDSTTTHPTTTHHAGRLVANLLQCSGAHQILSLSLSASPNHHHLIPYSALPVAAFQRWSRRFSLKQCLLMSADVNGTGRCLDLSAALGIPVVALSGELPEDEQFGIFLVDDLMDRGLKVTRAIEYLLNWVRKIDVDDVDDGNGNGDGGTDVADDGEEESVYVDVDESVQPFQQKPSHLSSTSTARLISIGVFITHALFSPGSYALLKRTFQHANSLGIPVSLFLTDSVQQDWERLEELKSGSGSGGVEIEVMGVGQLIAGAISEMMDRIK